MGAQRPTMLARDSAGKSISLLNNDTSSSPSSSSSRSHSHPHSSTNYDIFYESQSQDMVRSHSSTSKTSSSPPSLIREASYDSRHDHPITPTGDYIRSPYTQTHSPPTFFTYPAHPTESPDSQYPTSPLNTTTTSQFPSSTFQSCTSPLPPSTSSSTAYQAAPPGANINQKKYECKYRIQHNCDQTFTTSGHASRHSKIHDSLKGIACTHPGCPKKFTRSDNMKQHLETHSKDKKRDKGKTLTLTRASGVQKTVRPSSRASNGSTELSQRTKELFLYHPMGELDEREKQSNVFHASPISPVGSALDVLAAAADREMQTDKSFHP